MKTRSATRQAEGRCQNRSGRWSLVRGSSANTDDL